MQVNQWRKQYISQRRGWDKSLVKGILVRLNALDKDQQRNKPNKVDYESEGRYKNSCFELRECCPERIFDIVAMIHYLLHLQKTHVSNNKKQEQWKEIYKNKIQEKELYYTMLDYVQMKLKGIIVSCK